MSGRITSNPAGAALPLSVLHRACFPAEPWDAAALARILALSGGFGYLAWQEGSPVGFLLARDLGAEIEILSLGVMPAWRRRGIGRTLIGALVGAATRRGIGSIVLEVAVDNAAARPLYAACGFAQVGRRPRYYRGADGLTDALILRRSVPGAAPPE